MNSACDFLDRHRFLLNKEDDPAFVRAHEIFLQELAGLPEGFLDGIPPDERPEKSSFFIDCQLRWLGIQERGRDFQAGDPVPLALEMFGPEALRRMAPLEEAAGLGCRHMIMVGCGPLPLTILWIANRFPHLQYTALDTDASALDHARHICLRPGIPPIRFLLMNGRDYHYGNTDLVCIANQVRNKKEILQRIALALHTATVVIRVPYGNGWLIAEPVEEIPPSFSISGHNGECPRFLSQNLCLTIRESEEEKTALA